MNIGIVGAGAIADFLLTEINQHQMQDRQVTSVYVRNREKYKALELRFNVKLFTDLDDFLASGIDLVVEASTVEASKALLPKISQEKDVILISIGALADKDFLQEITDIIETHKHAIYLPSGAVGGLDMLQNAHALGAVSDVSLTTRKPADSLIDRPITEAQVVFEGKASDAIEQFPKNINVSIILSLAGIGMEKTKVKIIADPQMTKNTHTLKITGDFGTAETTITNNPLPDNPKTSYLAAMSILGTLKRLTGRIRIG